MVKLTEFKRFIGRSKQEMQYFFRFTQVFRVSESLIDNFIIAFCGFICVSEQFGKVTSLRTIVRSGCAQMQNFFLEMLRRGTCRSNSKTNYEKIKKQIVTLANTSINLTYLTGKFILIIPLRHVSLRLKTKLAHG